MKTNLKVLERSTITIKNLLGGIKNSFEMSEESNSKPKDPVEMTQSKEQKEKRLKKN